MLHRTSPRHAESDLSVSHLVSLRLRGLPMRALAESRCLASLGSFSSVSVALISALALIASSSGV